MCCIVYKTHAQTSAASEYRTYIGGYHIKCNGESNGTLTAMPSFGVSPYTYLWSTGETTRQINNKPAGIYIVTMTDSLNNTDADTFELKQPYPLDYQAQLSDYFGYNIKAHGSESGIAQLTANGGTPPYRYIWNSGDSISSIKGLTAGNYSFTITDANQCSTSGSITLTEPNPINISFSGVENPKCFKSEDGKATININGGLGDYSVVWDNGSFSLSPDDLHPGYNAVRIYEHGNAVLDTGIALTSIVAIEVEFTYTDYNGFNVSCVDCFNGSITTTTTGGTAPYTYLWDDISNSATANLSNLNGGDYNLTVIDANGCEASHTAQLTMPTPKDWSRLGNANIDTTEFIGSTDTSAVVFKTNNQEAMRLMGNGNVGLGVNNPTEKLEVNGLIKAQGLKLNNLSFKFEPATAQLPERIFFGATDNEISSFSSNSPNQFLCLNPTTSARLNVFSEAILFKSQACTPTLNPAFYVGLRGCDAVVELMKDGATTTGGPTWVSNKLLLNTLCGKDVVVGHVDGGNLVVNHNLGIGIINPTERLHVEGNTLISGKLGIGTTTPDQKLEINHNDPTGGILINKVSSDAGKKSEIKFNKNGGQVAAIGCDIDNNGKNTFFIWQNNSLPTPFIINAIGKVGIGGCYPPESGEPYKLYVEGGIATREIKVTTVNPFPDYVFNETYPLISIQELDLFVKKHKHLPGIASAKEVDKNDGFELGEMQRKMLEKLEEQTLYIIALQQQIDELKKLLPSPKN